MRALVAFFLDNLREILRLTAVWNPALTFGHDDSDEPSLVCALSPTKTLVPTLREDGGLAVARGWKHEELAGAAIGAGGGVVGGPVPLPTKRRVYCVLNSPHVHKDSRFHFEIRTHQRLIDIMYPTAQTIDSLMQLQLPAGVDVEVKL